jgi:CubicO group peptidase (beta-lactamase class C family)
MIALGAAALVAGGCGREEPATTWPTRPPAEAGLDPEAVARFRDLVGPGSSGCIVLDGALVHTWGGATTHGDWASATKPIVATLVLFALQEGRLTSLDEPVADFGWPLRPADRAMTVRHLLSMTSGYGLPEGPGEAWAYNNYATTLLYRTIYERVFGVPVDDLEGVTALVLHPDRLGPLGFEDGAILTMVAGLPRLTMTPRDFARVGSLWLERGTFDGRRILDEALFDEHLRPTADADVPRTGGGPIDDYLGLGSPGGEIDPTGLGPGVYGLNLWFNVGHALWPDVPADAYQANGNWNRQALTVVPSLGLVVAWHGSDALAADPEDFTGPMNAALGSLVEAVRRAGVAPLADDGGT